MDVFDEIAAGLRPRVPPAPTAIAKRGSDAELRLGYDLAKKVPDMVQRGFTIETAYGEIVVAPGPCADAIANVVRGHLQAQRQLASDGLA